MFIALDVPQHHEAPPSRQPLTLPVANTTFSRTLTLSAVACRLSGAYLLPSLVSVRVPTCQPSSNERRMSSNEDASRRSTPPSSEEPSRSRTHPCQNITFVDSQDPNRRSAIQRHTAVHSNAQRRDARLQTLRGRSRPRFLEWQRRDDSIGPLNSPPSSTSSTSKSSISPVLGANV